MQRFIENSRFLSLLAVLSLLAASALTFVLGVVKTVKAGLAIAKDPGDPLLLVNLIQVADVFLVATALWVFAVSLYELFGGKLNLPDWMLAHDLAELKTKLGSVLVLVMAGTFVEHLVEWKNAQETLLFALAIAVVSAVLIWLGNAGKSAS